MPPVKTNKPRPRIRVVKSFVATTNDTRGGLGDVVTAWLLSQEQKGVWIREPEIRSHLSSDESHHCLAIVVIGLFELREAVA